MTATLDRHRTPIASAQDAAAQDAAAQDASGEDASGKDDELFYDLIELMFFAYRDFVQDADRILADDGFGRAHHRVLYFVARRPGLTVAELLDILRITEQSLNRVLNDLLERGYMTNKSGESDRRQRRLYATPPGAALIRRIAEIQSARFARAFEANGGARSRAAAFLAAMIDRDPGDEGASAVAADLAHWRSS